MNPNERAQTGIGAAPERAHSHSGRYHPLVVGGAAVACLAVLVAGLFFGLHDKARAASPASAAGTHNFPESNASPTGTPTSDVWQKKLQLVADQNRANAHYNVMTMSQYVAAFEVPGDQVKTAYDLISFSTDRLQMLFNTGGTARRADGVQAMEVVTQAHNGHIPTYEEIKAQYGDMISNEYSGAIDAFVDDPGTRSAYLRGMNITATGHAQCYLLAEDNGPEPLIPTVDNIPMDTITVTANPESTDASLVNAQVGTAVTLRYVRIVRGSANDDWAKENNPIFDHIAQADETETWRLEPSADNAAGKWMLVGLSGSVISSNG